MLRTRWLGRGLALLLMLPALSGCGAPGDDPDSDLQSACGRTINLQEVELYDGRSGVSRAFVNRQRLAVGVLRWRSQADLELRYREEAGNVGGVRWCTGTLISHDLFLTAAHCVDPEDTENFTLPREKGRVLLTPAELARAFTVEFRYEVSAQTGLASSGDTFEVVRLEEYRLNGLDYALLRLSGNAGLLNGVTRISPRDAEPGSTVAILQHPAGTTMKIGAGPVASVQGERVSYATIDTLGGSSGAGILDAKTGKLVGVHTNGGCTQTGGGENYGVTISALIAASDTILDLVDRSKDFVVGDWDDDGSADLAVFHEGCLYPDANHDGAPDRDLKQCPGDTGADEYFVGRWYAGYATRLGWRRGGCVYLDGNPKQPLCYGDDRDRFEILIADWDVDGLSDIGVQRGACIDFDTDIDGMLDAPSYCFGRGLAEDQYLVGDWDGRGSDSIAVREGKSVLIDRDRDGIADETRVYGAGGNEAQYLAGDWNGEGRAKLAVRQWNSCLMTHDGGELAGEDVAEEEVRVYRDFWSAPQ